MRYIERLSTALLFISASIKQYWPNIQYSMDKSLYFVKQNKNKNKKMLSIDY